MTVYVVTEELKIATTDYDVADMYMFCVEMNEKHQDGWHDNIEDAEEEVRMLKEEEKGIVWRDLKDEI